MNIKSLISVFFGVTSIFALTISNGEFINNSLYGVDLSGTDVTVTSISSINFGTLSNSDSISWSGTKDFTVYGSGNSQISRSLSFTDSNYSLTVLEPKYSGQLRLLFTNRKLESHSSEVTYTFVGNGVDDSLEFFGFNGVWNNDNCYIASFDGGIVKFSALDQKVSSVLIPGRDTIYSSDDFNLSKELDDSIKPLDCAILNDSLLVLTKTDLWRTSLSFISWSRDTLPFGELDSTYSSYFPLSIRTDLDNIYLLGSDNGKSIISVINGDNTDVVVIKRDIKAIEPITKTKLVLFENSNSAAPFYIFDTDSMTENENLTELFRARITSVSGFNYGSAEYRAISSSRYDSTKISFAIATSLGLLFDSDFLDITEYPFNFIKRNVNITPDLKEVYSVPSILSSKDNRTQFEYSLSQEDRVTIEIYDYNLDFVCRIIDNELRNKGSDNGSGHSSDYNSDYWDGTVNNRGGRAVAPGLYYFRITTKKGRKAFGKVIIAKD